MKKSSRYPGTRGPLATTIVAMLGLTSGPLVAAAPPAPTVLAPEQITKLLEEGENILKNGNPELAIKSYFEPVNQSFMRETAKVGANDEVYASHGAT